MTVNHVSDFCRNCMKEWAISLFLGLHGLFWIVNLNAVFLVLVSILPPLAISKPFTLAIALSKSIVACLASFLAGDGSLDRPIANENLKKLPTPNENLKCVGILSISSLPLDACCSRSH